MSNLSVWTVEWLRLTRTRRLLALAITFLFFGFAGPVIVRYLPDLVSASAGSQVKITATAPGVASGISGYTRNATEIGLIVVVIVSASAHAIDARPTLSVFYRTRQRNFFRLLLPRFVITTVAAVGTYLVGLLAAWYETVVLIAKPDPATMVESAVLTMMYLAFAVAVAAAASTVARSTLGTVGYALIVLLLIPVVANVPAVTRWMPSTLAGASGGMLGHTTFGYYTPALLIAVAATIALLACACWLGSRREVS